MAEGTYEYQCMRAELLGIEKPDYEEFLKRVEDEGGPVDEEDLDTQNLNALDLEEESNKRITGGLEELNSILQKTQVKINRFKASCGSLTNLLRIKVAGRSDSSTSLNGTSAQTEAAPTETEIAPSTRVEGDSNDPNPRKSALAKALDTDLSKLDAMIEKAENAQYSMVHQSKQMKKFLN